MDMNFLESQASWCILLIPKLFLCMKYGYICLGSLVRHKLSVIFQSEKVQTLRPHAVTSIYCIASLHGDCEYKWSNLKNPMSPRLEKTPVLYMKKPGIYQCKVSLISDSRKFVFSEIFEVRAATG